MLTRLTVVLVMIPIAVVLIALTVANRETAAFTLDPFNPGNPMLTFHAPLFVFLYLALLTGLIVGGTATWLTQRKHRKRARDLSRQARKSQASADPGVNQTGSRTSGMALPAPGS